MRVFNNIEFIQINLSSKQDTYYLPDNSAIWDKKIDEIAFFAPDVECISPLDGTLVLSDLSRFYLDVVRADKLDLHKNVSCTLSRVAKNLRLPINTVISPNLTNIKFIGEDLTELDGKCIILYVTYQTENLDIELSNNQVTVTLDSTACRFSLNTLIDYYLLSQCKTCKAIEVQLADDSAPFYCDFKTFDNRAFRYVPSSRLEYQVLHDGVDVGAQIVNKLFINNFNFDFDNSFIINATEDSPIKAKLIFYY